MSMGGVALRGIPPGGCNRTPQTKPWTIREPPTDPNGTKAATIDNHLIYRFCTVAENKAKEKAGN